LLETSTKIVFFESFFCQNFKNILNIFYKNFQVVDASRQFVASIFGSDYDASELTCAEIVQQVTSNQPIILASLAGTDASYVVDDLARSLQKDMSSVAMGSPEGFTEAEKAISSASRTGKWVLLKNVHLAPSWLQQLEKKLHSLKAHQSFRLFLTSEISPKLPVNMLRTARILTYEPPPGMKSSMVSIFSNNANRMQAQPAERARLYFLLGNIDCEIYRGQKNQIFKIR
jgi:dynein heavy chain 1